jgi:hypothetical protein
MIKIVPLVALAATCFAGPSELEVRVRPTAAGVGLCLHDYNHAADGSFTHANLSNATEPGVDCDKKPYVWPLMVLGD